MPMQLPLVLRLCNGLREGLTGFALRLGAIGPHEAMCLIPAMALVPTRVLWTGPGAARSMPSFKPLG
jgi:hypothetical protein